jgi:hypothetical protein
VGGGALLLLPGREDRGRRQRGADEAINRIGLGDRAVRNSSSCARFHARSSKKNGKWIFLDFKVVGTIGMSQHSTDFKS